MPYPSTTGPPDITRALAERDISHVIRAPQKSVRADHTRIPKSAYASLTPIKEVYDEVHNSWNAYYKTGEERECKCEPVPGIALRFLTWKYDTDSARQAARPYLAPETPRMRSTYIMVAYGTNRIGKRSTGVKTSYVVHPDVIEKEVEPTGDIVARIAKTTNEKEKQWLFEVFKSQTSMVMAYYQ